MQPVDEMCHSCISFEVLSALGDQADSLINTYVSAYLSAWSLVGVPHSDPCSELMEMMD